MFELKSETINGYAISLRDGVWVAVKNAVIYYSNKDRFHVVTWAKKN